MVLNPGSSSLRATALWIWEANPFWGPLIVALVVGALIAIIWPCPVEREVRLIGMALQLLGVVTILMRLRAAHRQFPRQMLNRWWLRRPKFRVGSTVVSGTGTAMSMATARVEARVIPGPQATIEQQIKMLEDNYARLGDAVGGLDREVKKRIDDLSTKLTAETASREAGDKKTEEQVREATVGTLHLDAWGVIFFVVGIIAGTASPEIAVLIGGGSCG